MIPYIIARITAIALRLKPARPVFVESNALNSKNPNTAYSIEWVTLSECGNRRSNRGGLDIDENIKIKAA